MRLSTGEGKRLTLIITCLSIWEYMPFSLSDVTRATRMLNVISGNLLVVKFNVDLLPA